MPAPLASDIPGRINSNEIRKKSMMSQRERFSGVFEA
jgi:hypothetical protein